MSPAADQLNLFAQARAQYQILQTGFGAGKQFFATCAAWQAADKPLTRLHYVAIDPQPLSLSALSAALSEQDFATPALRELAQQLLLQWPPLFKGFHLLQLTEQVSLLLVSGEVADCLPQIVAEFDACYAESALSLAVPVSHHRLAYPTNVTVIGAGIAGASVARALARRGIAVTVLERSHPASGGSGNPVAVVRAEPGGAHHPITALSAAGVSWLMRWVATHGQSISHDFCGAIRITRDERRHQKLATHAQYFPPQWLREIHRDEASALAGQTVADAGFLLPYAGWIEPVALVHALLDHPCISVKTGVTVQSLQRHPTQGDWQMRSDDGLHTAACVVLASAFAQGLSPHALAIDSARGQLSLLPERAGQTLQMVMCRDGYITPAVNGMHTIGATMQKNDPCTEARLTDDAENFQRVQRLLPGFATDATQIVSGRVSWRAVTQDRLPLVGRIEEGLYASLAHGARGMSCAPLCGEWLAALMVGEALPLPAPWRAFLDPLRFTVR